MNRTDRLFNILLILQRRKTVTAADLAREFAVSPRTIYRDMDALGEMGVPIIAMPGEGFALVEGFYMPPLSFTADEAQALFLGAQMLAAQASGDLARHATSATAKIALILPENARRDIQQLLDIIHFYALPDQFDLDEPNLVQLQRAINEHRTVRITYHSYSRDEITERVIEPELLTFSGEAWYIDAYCRLRRANRNFRVDRIESLHILGERFTPRHLPAATAEFIAVQVRIAANSVRWVRERQHYGYVHDENTLPNGDIIMLYHVHRTDELKSWLLGWGAQAEILTPADLRAEIRDEVGKLAAMLT